MRSSKIRKEKYENGKRNDEKLEKVEQEAKKIIGKKVEKVEEEKIYGKTKQVTKYTS